MTQLIDIAAERGIGEPIGDMPPENRSLREMCRTIGFSIAADPDDLAVLRVRKALDPGRLDRRRIEAGGAADATLTGTRKALGLQ